MSIVNGEACLFANLMNYLQPTTAQTGWLVVEDSEEKPPRTGADS
jgi:hypothetical protein